MAKAPEIKIKFIGKHLLTAYFYRFIAGAIYDVVAAVSHIADMPSDRTITARSYDDIVTKLDEAIEKLEKPIAYFNLSSDEKS